MTPRRKNKKIVDRSRRVFAGPGYDTFKEAFPNVKSLIFEYVVYSGVKPQQGPFAMTIESFQPIISCPNERCMEGGFEVDGELSLHVFLKHLKHHEGSIHCSGYEHRGGRNRRHCESFIKYIVDVEYRE